MKYLAVKLALISGAAFAVLALPFFCGWSSVNDAGPYGSYSSVFTGVNRPLFNFVGDILPVVIAFSDSPARHGIELVGLTMTGICWMVLAFLVGALFDFAGSRVPPNTMRWPALPYVLFLIGLPAYLACFSFHICMAGHMKHPPYGFAQYANDFLWIALFLISAVVGFISRLRRPQTWFWCIILLVLCRLPFGSYGGTTIIAELPVAVYIAAVSISGLRPYVRNALQRHKLKQA